MIQGGVLKVQFLTGILLCVQISGFFKYLFGCTLLKVENCMLKHIKVSQKIVPKKCGCDNKYSRD